MYCQLKVYDWVFLVGFGCWGVLNTISGSVDVNDGIDLGAYPLTRSYTFGVRMNF